MDIKRGMQYVPVGDKERITLFFFYAIPRTEAKILPVTNVL